MYSELLKKYNVPGPRYTSYPTVPYWDDKTYNSDSWISSIQKSVGEFGDELSLYIHMPYCESLCTFCGCNKRITKNHNVELPYINGLLKEWELYLDHFGSKPTIKEIHLGGGTPTFFKTENIKILIDGILDSVEKAQEYAFSFEANPVNTTKEHLQVLFDLGFRRVSLGIQDFDNKVQFIINRIQTFDLVKEVTDNARKIGYTSINYDVIYGLPLQTKESIEDTFNKVLKLRPERIAYYSYAHVPWIKGNGQRRYSEDDLPKENVKRSFYELGRQQLLASGYSEIGMDHFGLPEEELFQAMEEGTLHRNFMGYIPFVSKNLIGLGVSSISDSWYGFSQNEKSIDDYLNKVNEGKLPLLKGHTLNEEDILIRQIISDIMCQFSVILPIGFLFDKRIKEQIRAFETDGLVELNENELTITELGKPFLRNVCMIFDLRLMRKKPETKLFSMTI